MWGGGKIKDPPPQKKNLKRLSGLIKKKSWNSSANSWWKVFVRRKWRKKKVNPVGDRELLNWFLLLSVICSGCTRSLSHQLSLHSSKMETGNENILLNIHFGSVCRMVNHLLFRRWQKSKKSKRKVTHCHFTLTRNTVYILGKEKSDRRVYD